MKALTVKQPWAWAIIHGGKNVENRNWMPSQFPGRIAIHAALRPDRSAFQDQAVAAALDEHEDEAPVFGDPPPRALVLGVILGTVQVVEIHSPAQSALQGRWGSCVIHGCAEWAQDTLWHWVLTDPRPCRPVPWKGRLGLWDAPDSLAESEGWSLSQYGGTP